MNALEERLREDLLRATEFAVEVDADAVLAAGRKDRTGRTVRSASVGMAAVVAVGLVAWSGMAGRWSAGVPEVGATVAATPSPVQSVTAPVQGSASFDVLKQFQTRTVTYTDAGEVTATPTLTPEVPATVQVRPQGSGRFELVATTVAGERTSRVVAVASGQVVRVELMPKLLVGMIGGQATWVDLRPAMAQSGAGWVETEAVGEALDTTAFVVAYPGEGASADEVVGVVWADQTGRVRDSEGIAVVSEPVRLGESEGVLYVEPGGAAVRYHDAEGRDLTTRVERGVSFKVAERTSAEEASWEATGLAVLPKGASEAGVRWRDGVRDRTWVSARLGDREVLLTQGRVATGSEPQGLDGGVASISYQLADGSSRSYVPEP